MKPLIFILFLLFVANAFGQTDVSFATKPDLKLMGFVDVFYTYDFNQPQGTTRQPFLFNHNRHNEFNINLGLIQLGLTHSKYRASFALQTGTYANDNYAAEPGTLQHIFEGFVGVSLNKENNFWLDVGVLPSHLGFESAISMDNWTLTRSLAAESSPYFLTGAKFTYSPNDQWEIAGIMANGWQRIQRLEGNSLPSFGTQLIFRPNQSTTLNWSTLFGTDDPDDTRRMRYFSNLYGNFVLSNSFRLIAGFDMGIQQRAKGSASYDLWLGPVVIGQFTLNPYWKTAFRAEYYQDEMGVIIPTGTPNGFDTTALSWNLDYSPVSHLACRFEAGLMQSKDRIFETDTSPSDTNFFIGTSLALKFEELLSRN